MNTTFYVFLAVGCFLLYLSALLFSQKVKKRRALIVLLTGIFFIVYAMIDALDLEPLSEPVPFEVDTASATANPITNGMPQEMNPTGPEEDVEIPEPAFRGDVEMAKYRANFWYTKAIGYWDQQLKSYTLPDSVIHCIDSALYYLSFAEAYNAKGQAYVQKGKLKEAVKNFSIAILLDSTKAQPYFNRGSAYYIMSQLGLACADWKRANERGYPKATTALNQYCR